MSQVRLDKPDFFTWMQHRQGRYELVRKRVVTMMVGSRGHAILVPRLATALEKRLDGTRWTVLTSDFDVDVGPSTVRYPDVVVDVAGGQPKDLTATAPVLIAEIISPSSARDDLGVKVEEYVRLPTLSAYPVFAQDEPKAQVWLRTVDGFSPKPRIFERRDASIEIASLGIDLPLAELYAAFEG
jgi:Uma2 family endonuclease